MPTANRTDARAARTRNALAGAMLILLEQRDFQKITVDDLCKSAQISRATFYIYFQDKRHLLRYTLSKERDRLIKGGGINNHQDALQAVLCRIREKQIIFRHLMAEPDWEIASCLGEGLKRSFAIELLRQKKEGRKFSSPINAMAAYHAGGFCWLLLEWAHSGFVATVEEMTERLLDLTSLVPPKTSCVTLLPRL